MEQSARLDFLRLSPLEWGVGAGLIYSILFEGLATGFGAATILVAVFTLPLIWRRRWPVAVFCCVGLSAFFTQTPYSSVAAVIIAMYAVGLYSRHNLLALGLLVGLALLLTVRYDNPAPEIPRQLFPLLILIVSWLCALAVRQQRTVADAFLARARSLESEQEQTARAARAEERHRIAREMHDVIAHSVSVMVVQAGAARSVLESAPDEATSALLAVEDTGRATLTELRGLLGVLGNDDGPELAPQPGMDQFESLIDRVTAAGLNVEVTINGAERPLSSGLSLTAYRVLQEALTNALKYADHARTNVCLTYSEAELKLEILNTGSEQPDFNGERRGRGLIGMRERVDLYGGRLEAGPRIGGGYAVRAWLPLNGAGK
ncbi:MAG TPA: histidine kinase [Nitrolancea sp.]